MAAPYNLSYVAGGQPPAPGAPPAGSAPFGMPPPYPAMPPPGAFPYPPAGSAPPPAAAPPLVVPPAINMGPIYNAPIPLVTPVPRPMQDGQTIHVTGSIPAGAKRFWINLSLGSGTDTKVGIALHINPRWDDGKPVVVRNSYLKNKWGSEERWGDFFPLTAGQNFECIILVQSDCFKIAFNGHHFCEFKHRNPKDQVSHLVVQGDVSVSCVWFQAPPHTGPPPSMMPMPGFPQMPPVAAGAVPADRTFPVPYKQQIPGALFAGRLINISGTPKSPSYNRFHINLGYNENMKKDIAFHFNPRYNEKMVVRNTMAGNNWGKEERAQPEFPFHPGKPFDIIILVEKDQYKVAVNGQHFITYQHRLRNLNHIKYLEIAGDVTLSSVRL